MQSPQPANVRPQSCYQGFSLAVQHVNWLDVTYDWRNLWVAGCVFEVFWLNPSDRFTVVHHFGPRFDEGVENDVAIEVHNRYSRESVAFLSQDSLTVNCKYFRLPTRLSEKVKLLTFLASVPN